MTSEAEGTRSGAADFTAEESARIRADFPILSRRGRGGRPIAYLDSSATSQKPNAVIDAVRDFYRVHNGAVHRGVHLLGDESTQMYEDARAALADFIHARAPEEVVFTKNATEGLNVVAYALGNASAGRGGQAARRFALGPGDRIVTTRAEHHANIVPWQELAARTGAELAWLDLTPDGRIDLDTLGAITPNTKVVAFTHVSNVTGAVSPVAAIVAAARKVGALTVLDTCQSSAHLPLDVQALGVDFAVFSSHKMLGPTGAGALWGRKELLEAMPPVLTGGEMINHVSMERTEFAPIPARFEAGSQPVAQVVGWAVALHYLKDLGMDRVEAHDRVITQALLEGIGSIPAVHVLGPKTAQNRVGVVAFTVDGVHPHDVGQYLDAQDVAVRVGHHCAIPLHEFFGLHASARASTAPTTTLEDVQRLTQALAGARSYFLGARA